MPITVEPLPNGSLYVNQSLVRPIIYLDHWAVRLFADEPALQQRLLTALRGAGGTLLFSQHNFEEFSAMTDMEQANRVELFLDAMLPNVYVADFTVDPGFTFTGGAPADADHPGQHWLFKEVAYLAAVSGGVPTFKTMVTGVIANADMLAPVFADMKQSIAAAVQYVQNDPNQIELAKNFKPVASMTLQEVLRAELLREPQLGNPEEFSANDAMDWVHAVPAVTVCDFVLLDGKWCDKVSRADRRMRKAGMRHTLAKRYSRRGNGIADFLAALEAAGSPQSGA
jgi:hypothetical protein